MKQCYLPGWWGATLLIYMSEEVQEPLSTKLKRCKTANLPEWWGAQIFPHSTQKESGILCSGTDQHQPMDNVRGAWPNIYWPPKKYGAPPNINKTQKGLWLCSVQQSASKSTKCDHESYSISSLIPLLMCWFSFIIDSQLKSHWDMRRSSQWAPEYILSL